MLHTGSPLLVIAGPGSGHVFIEDHGETMLIAVLGNVFVLLLIAVSVLVIKDEQKQLVAEAILSSISIMICVGISIYYGRYLPIVAMAIIGISLALCAVWRPRKPR